MSGFVHRGHLIMRLLMHVLARIAISFHSLSTHASFFQIGLTPGPCGVAVADRLQQANATFCHRKEMQKWYSLTVSLFLGKSQERQDASRVTNAYGKRREGTAGKRNRSLL